MENLDNYLKKHSPNIQVKYKKDIELFLEWAVPFKLQENEFCLQHFQGYINHIQEKSIKNHAISMALTALRHYGYMLVSTGTANEKLAADLYIKGIHKQALPSLLSYEEVLRIFKQWQPKGIAGKRNKVILGIKVFQALTEDELKHLQPEHIDLTNRKIKIPSTFAGKKRTLKLHKIQLESLQHYLLKTRLTIMAISEKESNQLFISLGEKERFNNITNKMLQDLKKQFPQFTSYTHLRASVLAHWHEKYGLTKTIKMAGHHYIQAASQLKKRY